MSTAKKCARNRTHVAFSESIFWPHEVKMTGSSGLHFRDSQLCKFLREIIIFLPMFIRNGVTKCKHFMTIGLIGDT